MKEKDNEKNKFNRQDSMTAKLGLTMIFNTIITGFLSQQVFYNPKTIFVAIVLSLTSNSLFNSCLKDIEFEKEISSFSKKMLRIRKKLAPVLLSFQVTITLISAFYVIRKEAISFYINKNNPFTNKEADFNIDTSEIDLLMESIDNNILLSEIEKEQIKKLEQYFEENQFLNYEKIYYNYATSDIIYPLFLLTNNKENLSAEYLSDINLIKVYRKEKIETSLPHEAVHQTGYLDTYFLREGFTSLIVSEYCCNGAITNGYMAEIYLTEIIMEMVGKNTVLEAYSTRNESLIRNTLQEKLGMNEIEQLLQNFDAYSQAKRKYDLGEIDYDSLMIYFSTAGDILNKTLDKLNLTTQQKQYITYCYVSSATIQENIPKFCLNTQKNQSYPDLDSGIQESIDDLYSILYEDGKKQQESSRRR